MQKLIHDALVFAELAAGEGVCFSKTHNRPEISPEEFLMDYSNATDDEGWETIAKRVADRVGELERLERKSVIEKEAEARIVKMREEVDDLSSFILEKRLKRKNK